MSSEDNYLKNLVKLLTGNAPTKGRAPNHPRELSKERFEERLKVMSICVTKLLYNHVEEQFELWECLDSDRWLLLSAWAASGDHVRRDVDDVAQFPEPRLQVAETARRVNYLEQNGYVRSGHADNTGLHLWYGPGRGEMTFGQAWRKLMEYRGLPEVWNPPRFFEQMSCDGCPGCL
jgi:hypothetical protein